jgi:hypothetical protein
LRVERAFREPEKRCCMTPNRIRLGQKVTCAMRDSRLSTLAFAVTSVSDAATGWIHYSMRGSNGGSSSIAGLTTYHASVAYEEAIRDLTLAAEHFAVADISDLPWTEIDFSDDVTRGGESVLPQLGPIQ